MKKKCTCGADEDDRAHQFLRALYKSFQHVRSQILMMDPLPTMAKMHSLCIQEEKSKGPTSKNMFVDAIALAVQKHFKKNGKYENR